MEKIKIEFKCKIHKLIENGFVGIVNEYLIQFQDKKYNHLFKPNDTIAFVIENADKPKQEEVQEGYSVLYCVVRNYLSNGFLFIDPESPQKGIFWDYRGLLTHKMFEEHDYWEKNTLLRVMLRKKEENENQYNYKPEEGLIA